MPGRLADRRFRASAAYEAVAFGRLTSEESQAFARLRTDRSLYGILRPRLRSGTMKSISHDAARLFLELAEREGNLPTYVAREGKGADAHEQEVIGLVLEGVLELETSGGFVSGSGAVSYLEEWLPRPISQTTRLSEAALAYGATLPRNDRLWLSGRLYGFNRTPITPRSRNELEGRGAIELAGLDTPETKHRLATAWRSSTDPTSAWRHYRRIDHLSAVATHKLYVSPVVADLPAATAAAIPIMERNRVIAFKVGRSLDELLRPDKFVIYLPDRDSLMELAAELGPAIRGLRQQGVPFTALLDAGGLLSWGMDPPGDKARLPWQGPSWRRWLTDVMAASIVEAAPDATPSETSRAALARISAQGVDPMTWVPREDLWTVGASGQ